MAFEYRFNVIRFYSKLNRFVLSPRKKPNHFVLKIRPGGFADYNKRKRRRYSQIISVSLLRNNMFTGKKYLFHSQEMNVS